MIVNPIKMSQPAGAALAFLGVKDMITLWHGVQGCTAFAKILFISHFREPMPFQNTAIGQTNVVMGSEQNIHIALDNIRNQAEIVGLITTAVAETSGVDIESVVRDYQKNSPGLKIVCLNTPDYEGDLQMGYIRATKALIEKLAAGKSAKKKPKQIAVFPGPYITPGEIEELRAVFNDFNCQPLFCPDLGDGMYGCLLEKRHSPCSIGGIDLSGIRSLPESELAISVGSSMEKLAREFGEEFDMPTHHFSNLATVDEIDRFFLLLEKISKRPAPIKYARQRQRLLDTLIDADVYFHGKRAAVAGDSEFVIRRLLPLNMLGIETIGLSNRNKGGLGCGDLSEFKKIIRANPVDLILGNTHVAELAEQLEIPCVRCGIPVSDRLGEPQAVRIGYNGAAGFFRECANKMMASEKHTQPYQSKFASTLI